MITVKKSKSFDQYRKFLKEFEKRLNYSMNRALGIVADSGKEFLKSRIPDSDDSSDYKDSLKVRMVNSPNKKEPLVAILSDTSDSSRRLSRDVKPSEDVIYIKIKRHFGARVEPWMDMLESMSPWTLDTLPYIPSEKEADIIYRRVTINEIDSVRKTKKKQKIYIRDMLRRYGIRPEETFEGEGLDIKENDRSAIPDFAFNALRMEFGIGKSRAVPHWKPMQLRARTSDLNKILKDKEISDVLTNPKNNMWKKPEQRKSITINEAIELTKFQRKLG